MSKEINSDQSLLERIKDDDKTAFKLLFNKYYREMVGTAVNMLKDESQAKDAVQDVLYQIWKSRAKLEVTTSLKNYLKRSVINRCLNQIRSQKDLVSEDKLIDQPTSNLSALDELAYEDLNDALQAALDQLPERCRLIFVMKRLEGMSHQEISAELGISPKTIENQITKALKALKEALQGFRKKNKP